MSGKAGSGRRALTMSDRDLVKKAKGLGALRAKVIGPATVDTSEWVRWKCQFGCGGYGSSLCCPPHSPRPAQTRRMLDEYKRAVLFESPRLETKEIAVRLERELFLAGYYKAFGLGAGPCRLCDACGFEEGCRHPQQARPAMEASGIDVFATVRKHGFEIEVVGGRDHPQHYFGLVLVE
jgi:predicted metal-binding protein